MKKNEDRRDRRNQPVHRFGSGPEPGISICRSSVRRVIAGTIVVCVCSGIAAAQLPTTTELGNRVDAIAKQTLSRPVAGISVAVARDGQVVIARGYGMANLEHSVAVTL